MNIRKTYHRWISALLVFMMVFTMVPIQLFQSPNSTAYAAGSGYVGDSTGSSNFSTGKWRASWGMNQQGVRVSIVDNDGTIMLENYDAADILFSNPNNFGNNVERFTSIKFQDYDVENDIYEIPVGDLNNLLIESILKGPSSELLTHFLDESSSSGTTLPFGKEAYPTKLKTMPRPIEEDANGVWYSNGVKVKEFFIDGKLGTFKDNSYYVSYNKLNVITGTSGNTTPTYNSPTTSNNSGSSSTNSTTKTENTSSVTNTSNTNLIQTPYGNVTYDWLRNHFMNTSYRSSQEAYDSGFMTTAEKRALVHKLESAQAQFRLLTSTAIDDDCNLTKSEFNEGIETIYNRFNILANSYYSGSVTYEYLRVANAELRTMANSAKTLYKNALSIADNAYLSNHEKRSVLEVYEDWAESSQYYITSDFININEIILGDIVGYDNIPLASASLKNNNSFNTPTVTGTKLLSFIDMFATAYKENEVDAANVALKCLEYIYKDQAKSIGDAYVSSKFGTGIGALAADIIDQCVTTINGEVSINKDSLADIINENIESRVDNVTKILEETQFENMLNMESNQKLAIDQTMAEFGSSSHEMVTAAHVKSQIIPSIVQVMHSDGFTDITYEDILSVMEGQTEEEKLNIAANQINTIGLGEWLKDLNVGSLVGAGGGLDLGAISNANGYIYALLDIKDDKGEFVFDIHIPEDKQSEFNSVAADPTSPAQKFMYMGYGIVLEPIVWYAPVSYTRGYEHSDDGEYREEAKAKMYRADRMYYMTPTAFARYQMADQNRHWLRENGHTNLGKLFPTSMYIDEDITYFQGGIKDDGIIQGLSESDKFTGRVTGHLEIAPKVSVKNMDAATFGYGWHFSAGTQQESTLQVTWNDTVPSPGEAPDPTPLPDPSKGPDGNPWDPSDPDYPYTDYPNGYPDKHFNIIKYYEVWDYSDPSNPTLAEQYGPTIREQNPNIIRVVDEPEFKVEDWYTTALNGNLPAENDTRESYSANSAKDTHVQDAPTGNKVATVTMDKQNDGSEDTLVVQLVKKINQQQLPPGQGAITIQQSQLTKVVRTNNVMNGGAPWGNYKFDLAIGEFLDEHTRRHIYCYCPGHGNEEDGYWSHSSPCRHRSEACSLAMPGLDGDTDITFKFRGLHTVSFGNGLEVGNKSSQLKPVIYSNGSKNDVSTYDFTLNSLSKKTFKFTSDGEALQGEEYVTVIWRYKDVPTMPLYKKADVESLYGVEHWEIPDSILPSNQKIPDKKRLSNGDNIYSLSINFGVDLAISDIRAVASCLSSDSSGDCGASTGCTYKDPRDAFTENGTNWTYMFNAQTTVKTWRGVVSNKSFADEKMLDGNTEKIQKRSFNTHFETTMVEDTQTIKFYPYIKMTYMTNSLSMAKREENGENVRQLAYVFSEHESSFLPNDAIEVGWTNPNEKGSLNIVSQQWSLHKRATDNGKAWNGANQVLPGGAIYQLVVPEAKTDVKIVTYQTVVDSETRTWLSANLTGDEYTETQVMNEHKQFVDTAVDVLDKLRVVQWVNKNFNATYAWPDNWDENAATTQVCVRGGGIDLTKLGLSHKSNTETKYYMQKFDFGSPASEGDLDILMKKQITTVFKVFTDTEGNVYVARTDNAGSETTDVAALVARMKDVNADTFKNKRNTTGIDWDSIDVSDISNKGVKWQDINGKLTGEFEQIDDRTKIITNVVKSLERNTGNDTTAFWAKPDGKWYNEAFDGIYLVRQATTLTVGFQDPLKRAAALDPALCPENKGESDLYSNAFLSQFCMNDKSDSPLAAGKDSRYLGTFKGNDIQLPEMQGLYQTRKFYIPNVNVQDLN